MMCALNPASTTPRIFARDSGYSPCVHLVRALEDHSGCSHIANSGIITSLIPSPPPKDGEGLVHFGGMTTYQWLSRSYNAVHMTESRFTLHKRRIHFGNESGEETTYWKENQRQLKLSDWYAFLELRISAELLFGHDTIRSDRRSRTRLARRSYGFFFSAYPVQAKNYAKVKLLVNQR